MYIEEAVEPLLKSLFDLSDNKTDIFLAYGRNRAAERSFLAKCKCIFSISDVTSCELDEKYQCTDVRVLRLRRKAKGLDLFCSV